MRSQALRYWIAHRQQVLDELEAAHRAVGGTGQGRRVATQQINQAYAVMLCSQMQAFCRDLHTEAADHFVTVLPTPDLRRVVHLRLVQNRLLDRGNPNPGNLGADFRRFGITLWDAMRRRQPSRSPRRQGILQELTNWRNAIAHQDFTDPRLGGRSTLQLREVQSWRRTCVQISIEMDEVIADHLGNLVGHRPW